MNVKNYINNPWTIWVGLQNHGLGRWIPDSIYLKTIFRQRMGYRLNLKDPKTYNEKLQWLKLYDRKEIYTTMVDKCDAKRYVAGQIGEEHIIPTLGVWDSVEDIDFETLPRQFVLKCTHDSGGVIICTNKDVFDIEAAKKKLETALKTDYYLAGREWPYKNVKPRIIAEQYMVDESGYELKDYKFFCFNGEVKAMFVAKDRTKLNEEVKFDFFDENFQHLDVRHGHPNSEPPYIKPDSFEEMKDLARIISKGIPQVRIDFYNVSGRIYFGEITLFHHCGLVPFDPPVWDNVFGDWIELPQK